MICVSLSQAENDISVARVDRKMSISEVASVSGKKKYEDRCDSDLRRLIKFEERTLR